MGIKPYSTIILRTLVGKYLIKMVIGDIDQYNPDYNNMRITATKRKIDIFQDSPSTKMLTHKKKIGVCTKLLQKN